MFFNHRPYCLIVITGYIIRSSLKIHRKGVEMSDKDWVLFSALALWLIFMAVDCKIWEKFKKPKKS